MFPFTPCLLRRPSVVEGIHVICKLVKLKIPTRNFFKLPFSFCLDVYPNTSGGYRNCEELASVGGIPIDMGGQTAV